MKQGTLRQQQPPVKQSTSRICSQLAGKQRTSIFMLSTPELSKWPAEVVCKDFNIWTCDSCGCKLKLHPQASESARYMNWRTSQTPAPNLPIDVHSNSVERVRECLKVHDNVVHPSPDDTLSRDAADTQMTHHRTCRDRADWSITSRRGQRPLTVLVQLNEESSHLTAMKTK